MQLSEIHPTPTLSPTLDGLTMIGIQNKIQRNGNVTVIWVENHCHSEEDPQKWKCYCEKKRSTSFAYLHLVTLHIGIQKKWKCRVIWFENHRKGRGFLPALLTWTWSLFSRQQWRCPQARGPARTGSWCGPNIVHFGLVHFVVALRLFIFNLKMFIQEKVRNTNKGQ